MTSLLSPPVAEISNIDTGSVESAMKQLRPFYQKDGNFNYLTSTKAIKAAYKGLHSKPALLAGFDKPGVGVSANRDVVELASPFAFGRKTQVFDLPPRKFAFGKNRLASYRIPFFFVEDGIVKAYFLLPRKGPYLSHQALCCYATIVDTYLLKPEFYGQRTDVEIVDVGATVRNGPRVPRSYSLADLKLWPEERLQRHLTVVAQAIDNLEAEGVEHNKRLRPLKDKELPLFD